MKSKRSVPSPEVIKAIETTSEIVLDLSDCHFPRKLLIQVLQAAQKNKNMIVWNFRRCNFISGRDDCFDAMVDALIQAKHVLVLNIEGIITNKLLSLKIPAPHLKQIDYCQYYDSETLLFKGLYDLDGRVALSRVYNMKELSVYSRPDTMLMIQQLEILVNLLKPMPLIGFAMPNMDFRGSHKDISALANFFEQHNSLREVDLTDLSISKFVSMREPLVDPKLYCSTLIQALAKNPRITRVSISSSDPELQQYIEAEIASVSPKSGSKEIRESKRGEALASTLSMFALDLVNIVADYDASSKFITVSKPASGRERKSR